MENEFIITAIDRVIMVGKDEYPDQVTVFGNTLRSNELIFHFSGHARVCFDGLVLETKPNTVRFLPKGNTKEYKVLRRESGECIDVCFQTDRPVSPCAFVTDGAKNEQLGALFKKLFSTWVGKESGYYFKSLSLLYKILAELQSKAYIPATHYQKIKPALDMIREEFPNRDFSVKQLADICGIGESYFLRLFKEKYGISPKKYLVGLRMNHAAELLRLDGFSVTQIAILCGFSDVYFFSRQFKSHMGISPTEFAKKYRSSK